MNNPKRGVRRIAFFNCSAELLEKSLHIPENHLIVGAKWDFDSQSIKIYVEGPELPEVRRGEYARKVSPKVTETTGENNCPIYKWEWDV